MSMTDVSDQIRAWADAAAPANARPSVRSDEVVSMTGRRGRRRPPRLLAVAAGVVFVAALAGLVVVATRDTQQSVTTGPTPDTSGGAPVTFDLLTISQGSSLNDLGVLRSASSAVELAGLWEVAGADGPAPTVDFGEQMVVSFTLAEERCPSSLDGFDRDRSTLTPRFVDSTVDCEDPQSPPTYVVAVDRSTTGAEFRLHLVAPPDAELGDTFLHVGGAERPFEGAAANFVLSADTVAAGEEIAGTVQVNNQSAEAVERTTCGPYFVAVLEGDAGASQYFRPACAEPFVIPPGRSSYPVTVKASSLTCINGDASGLVPACLPDGTMPPLPPGTYEATIDQPDDPIPMSGPLTVTIT
jgi:hypothetical protein